MGSAFDQAPDRPEHIDVILSGLDRYNPETTTVFQDYVVSQCENQTYDSYANLALLKLYQFNPHLSRDETITNILAKSLTVFPSADFSLCLSLLPPNALAQSSSRQLNGGPAPPTSDLAESVQRLTSLHSSLNNAQYESFWAQLERDDALADLVADVAGFEELMRVRVAVVVGQCMQSVDAAVLESWLGFKSREKLERFVSEVCGWKTNGDKVEIPLSKENEARSTVVRENVRFEQFGRTVRRAFEQPA